MSAHERTNVPAPVLLIPLEPAESMILAAIVISKAEPIASPITKFRVDPFRSTCPAFVPAPLPRIKPVEVPVPVKVKETGSLARNLTVPGVTLSDSKFNVGLLLLPGSVEKFKKPGYPAKHPYDFSPKTVAAKAKAAFLEWAGTTDMDIARDRYLNCLAQLPPK